jgi:hypothetical protein
VDDSLYIYIDKAELLEELKFVLRLMQQNTMYKRKELKVALYKENKGQVIMA